MRSGWVMASTMPAIALASTWRDGEADDRGGDRARGQHGAGQAVEARELRDGQGDADHDDRRLDHPAQEAQARVEHRAQLAAPERLGQPAPAAAHARGARRDQHERREQRQPGGDQRSPSTTSAATMRAGMARTVSPERSSSTRSARWSSSSAVAAAGRRSWPRAGWRSAEDDARAAMLAEMAYYRAHHDEAGDGRRSRTCAAAAPRSCRTRSGTVAAAAPTSRRRCSRRCASAPTRRCPPSLRALRAGGARLVVVSNWDVSLHDVLARTGLRPLVDARRHLGRAGRRPSPTRRSSAPALEPAGGRGRRTRCTSATASRPTSPAPAPRASRRCSSPATAPAGARRRADDHLAGRVAATRTTAASYSPSSTHGRRARPASRRPRSASRPSCPSGVSPAAAATAALEAVDGVGGAHRRLRRRHRGRDRRRLIGGARGPTSPIRRRR